MEYIPLKDIEEWIIQAVGADGLLSGNEKRLLHNFADTFGLSFEDIEARASELSERSRKEVVLLGPNYISGYAFEKFIVKSLCKPINNDSRLFSLVKWRGDKCVDGIFAEDDKNPDLMLRCLVNRTCIDFFLECKYRKYWNTVPVFNKSQLLRYAEFSRSVKRIVLIACGFGGSPDKPEKLSIATIGDFLNRRKSIELLNPDKVELQSYVFNIIWNRCKHRNLF